MRLINLVFASLAVLLGASGQVFAISIQFGNAQATSILTINSDGPFASRLDIPAQNFVDAQGRDLLDWRTTAGTLLFILVPGPAGSGTSQSAELVLTGIPGADGLFGTADDSPFEIIYKGPVSGNNANAGVAIRISSAQFGGATVPPVEFDPIAAPLFLAAAIDGSVISGVRPLASGVTLEAGWAAGKTNGLIGTLGPFAAPGAFSAGTGPVPKPDGSVRLLTDDILFKFDPTRNLLGDRVSFPNSIASGVNVELIPPVIPEIPEPGTLTLLAVALLATLASRGAISSQDMSEWHEAGHVSDMIGAE